MQTYQIGTHVYAEDIRLSGIVVDSISKTLYQVMGKNGRLYKVAHRFLQVKNNKPSSRGRKPFVVPVGIKVPWHQKNAVLAKLLNVSALTVFNLKRRLGIEARPRGVVPLWVKKIEVEGKSVFKYIQKY